MRPVEAKTATRGRELAAWRAQHKFRLQVLALIVLIVAPLALFAALSGQQVGLAAACFSVITLGMALTLWVA